MVGAAVSLIMLLGGCATATGDQQPAPSRATQSADQHAQLTAFSDELLIAIDQLLGTDGPSPQLVLDAAHPALVGTQVAAVTISAGDTADVTRIVLDPTLLASASTLQLRALLAHELVHVRLQPTTHPSTPLWAVEGFADLIAFTVAAAPHEPLRRAARANGAVTGLPPDSAFSADAPAQSAAYAQSWWLWQIIADQAGVAAARQIYGAISASGDIADFDQALDVIVGTSADELIEHWLTDVQES